MKKNTCAIIVTYNPNIELLTKLVSSLKQQCPIIIVDNYSLKPYSKQIDNLIKASQATLIPLSENAGIAKAQNTGIQYVEENLSEIRYVAFFDQDSIPESNFIDTLYSEYFELEKSHQIAMIGPSLYDPRSESFHAFHLIKGWRYLHIAPEQMPQDTIECFYVNSSGSFCALNIFKQVGGYNDDFFIDHVETEWNLRARDMGYCFYGTKKTKLIHYMGDDIITFSILAKKVTLPYRNPLRHQYLFRNSVYLLKQKYVPFSWKFHCFIKLSVTFIAFGYFSNETQKQRRAMIDGVHAGIKNTSGKIE